jgi:hypothetical protein
MNRRLVAAFATMAALTVTGVGAQAAHADGGSPTILTTDVIAPFNLAVHDGSVYVADGGTSAVSKIRRTGLVTKATGPQPGEVAGVAFNDRTGAMAYTTTSYADGATTLTIKTGGKTVVADLDAFEARRNPDGRVLYGVRNPSQCVIDALTAVDAPVSYKGLVESHPYSVTAWGDSDWVVADAAGNDLLKVDRMGHVSLVAVLPAQPLKITAEMAAAQGLPDCVVGITYRFEPVPTDVEVGPNGMLYVSTLPGGPEDPSLGARGSVYRVNPWTGRSTLVATGFAGATNVAVTPGGAIYVAELFGGKVSVIRNGKTHTFMTLENALAVEWGNGHLYASTLAPFDENGNPSGNGSVVRLF